MISPAGIKFSAQQKLRLSNLTGPFHLFSRMLHKEQESLGVQKCSCKENNTCCVPYSVFPLIKSCSIKHKVCAESVCHMRDRLPGQSASGKRQCLEGQQLLTTEQPECHSWKLLLRERGDPYPSLLCAQSFEGFQEAAGHRD